MMNRKSKKLSQKDKIYYVISGILIIYISSCVIYVEYRLSEACEYHAMTVNNFTLKYQNDHVAGYYSPSQEYYCVWLSGRNQDFVDNTDKHEYCHYLLDQDKEHFCEFDYDS